MAEASQAEILEKLDADAGWAAAKVAEQRSNELSYRFRAVSERSRENQPLLAAFSRITRILKESTEALEKLRKIQETVDEASTESARIRDKIHGPAATDENVTDGDQVILS